MICGIGAAIAATVFAASWLLHPGWFEASLAAEAIDPTADLTLLFGRGTGKVYLTSHDILHPESFSKPGTLVQGVVLDYPPDDDATATPAWNKQVLYAIRGQDANGEPQSANDSLNAVDVALRDHWGADFPMVKNVPTRHEFHAGEPYAFGLPVESSFAGRSGLREVIAIGVAPGKDTDGAELAAALGKFKAEYYAPMRGIAISYMPLATDRSQSEDAARNFEALFAAADRVLRQAWCDTVVIGTWAKTGDRVALLQQSATLAWSRFRGSIESDAKTLTDEPLRMSAVGLVAAFIAALLRRDRMTVAIAVASFFAMGAALATGGWLLTWLQPLLGELVPAGWLAAASYGAAALCGWFLRRVLAFDPNRLVTGG